VKARNNVWMSVSDLMTGLMVIFLFITVAYIKRVHSDQSMLKDFVENKQELHDKLVEKFKTESDKKIITIGGDLTMRFQRAETLFDDGSWTLRPEFEKQLSTILPKYLDVILSDSLKYKIKEIRIEGHTNNIPFPQLNSDPYIANLILSQRRAQSVMEYLRNMPEYQQYSDEDQRLLDHWFTATGYSYGHALDKNGELSFTSGKAVDPALSRRVEFRIVTAGEDVLENFVEKTQD